MSFDSKCRSTVFKIKLYIKIGVCCVVKAVPHYKYLEKVYDIASVSSEYLHKSKTSLFTLNFTYFQMTHCEVRFRFVG